MSTFLSKLRPTILLAVLGLIVLGVMGLLYDAVAATTAATTGIVALSRDIIGHDDKVTEAETSVKINSVSQKLDENTPYYPSSSIVLDGINPAMRLIAMRKVHLTRRTTQVISAESVTVDLRQAAPRLWRLKRVVLGTITGDDPSISGTEYRRINPASLESIAWQRDWFLHRGAVTQYWHYGQHWIGMYKRPIAATTITLIFDAMPLAFTIEDITGPSQSSPELPEVYHPMIADIAYALLIVKEGAVESTRAEQVLQLVFGQELTKGLRRALRSLQQAEQLAGSTA